MVNHHTHPDPAIAALIDRSRSELHQSLARMRGDPDPEANGSPSSPLDTQALQTAVERLCEEENWAEALPAASRLFLARSQEPRIAYLLATCLQRLGIPSLALAMFKLCTQLEQDAPTPGPLFRAGECLAAMNQPREALEAFEASIEHARTDDRHATLMAWATDKAQALSAHA